MLTPRLSQILAACPDGAVAFDAAGAVCAWNQALAQWTGLPEREALGRPVQAALLWQGAGVEDIVGAALAGESRTVRGTLDTAAKMPCELKFAPLRGEDGAPAGGIAYLRVLVPPSPDSAVYSELDRTRAGREPDRGQTQYDVLAALTQELRAPASAILGWSTMLATGKVPAADYPPIFANIECQAQAQMRLLDDLADVAKIAKGQLQLEIKPVDLWPAVARAVDAVRLAAGTRAIELAVDGSPAVGLVSGDAARLGQIVETLLAQAVASSPSGGRIELALKRVDPHAVLTVKDEGDSVEPAQGARIFARFPPPAMAEGRTGRIWQGSALGLALVRQLAELHGGTAEAASAGPGRGVAWTVKLPLAAGPAPSVPRPDGARAARAASSEPGRLSGRQVLVVDDSPDALMLLRAVLKRYGAEVLTASSVAEAMSVLQNEEPHVIVSDISMPDETGFDLLRKVKTLEAERQRPYPVAALTAHARKEEREEALLAGFHAYIAKPFEQKALIQTLVQLVEGPDLQVP